jgi:F1F0 ATPase subunit 2
LLVGLEMDANGMSIVYLAVGILAGVLYFKCLAWTVHLFTEGGSAAKAIFLMIGRIAVLGGVLALASWQGALPLLMMALGVFIARFVVIRRVLAVQP